MKIRNLMLSAAALTFISGTALAETATIKTETYTDTVELENVNPVDFSVFDTNNDGKYSMEEVGERLFDSFDLDDNGSIDNMEWDERSVMTITPIERETFQFVDLQSDGTTDYSTYDYDMFYKESGLMRFDDNKNGLSAKEFIETDFQALDDNDNNLIEMKEWKDAYIESRLSSASKKEYN